MPTDFYIERGEKMAYMHKILEKATIRGIADFMLFGLGPDEDTRTYEERLDELYDKFEEAVNKYDSSSTPELLDLSNALTSETASVYTEIGLQLGMLLALDMANNMRREKNLNSKSAEANQEAEELRKKLYQMQAGSSLQETLKKDKEYQETEREIRECTEKMKSASTDGEQSGAVEELFEILDRKLRIYGKAAYSQGFYDAAQLIKYYN